MYLFMKHVQYNQLHVHPNHGLFCKSPKTASQSNVNKITDKSFYSLKFFKSMWFKQIIMVSIKFMSTADHISNIIVGIWLFRSKTNHNIVGLCWGYAVAATIAGLLQVLHLVWNFPLNNQINNNLTKILIKIGMTFVGLVGYIVFLVPWPCFVHCDELEPSCLCSLYPYIRLHRTVYPVMRGLINNLHGFFVRISIEILPFTVIMVSILASGCNCNFSHYNDGYNRCIQFICDNIVSIIYVSLCLKITSALITLFVLRIACSRRISFHTQLSDALICIAESTRFVSSFGIMFLAYWLKLDQYYILLQIYMIPSLISITILAIYDIIRKHKSDVNSHIRLMCLFFWYFACKSWWFYTTFNIKTIAFNKYKYFLANTTWDSIHCTIATRSYTYYSVLNKTSHYLANYRNINHNNIQLNQQIGCINYQILDYCKHYLECDPNPNRHFPTFLIDSFIHSECRSIKAHFVAVARQLEHSLQTQQLCNSIQLLEQKSAKIDAAFPFTNSVDIFVFNVISALIDQTLVTDFFCDRYRYNYPGEFAVVAVSIVISMMNGIMFPYFWWLFVDYKVNKRLQYFVNFWLYLLAVLYIATIWVLIRYQFPLFYKMKHVLPTSMMLRCGSSWEYRKAVRHVIRHCFRDCDEFVPNRIDDALINAAIRQYNDLQSRPMVEQVLCAHFGKDVGQTICQYVPVWDQNEQRSIYDAFSNLLILEN